MNYEKELVRLSDKFEALKTDLATQQGALKNAVASLSNDHGISNAADAKRSIEQMERNIDEWKAKRTKLMAELEEALKTVNGGDSDEGHFDDDFD